jgi:hypothetical protein
MTSKTSHYSLNVHSNRIYLILYQQKIYKYLCEILMDLFLLAYCIKILKRCTHKCMIKVKKKKQC